MREQNTAFILILVLIFVVAILAIPKYVKISRELKTTSARNISTLLSSASAINYIQMKSNVGNGVSIHNCRDVLSILNNMAVPAEYEVADLRTFHDMVVTCKITGPGNRVAQFNIIGVR